MFAKFYETRLKSSILIWILGGQQISSAEPAIFEKQLEGLCDVEPNE
jgi:hypothetical protein